MNNLPAELVNLIATYLSTSPIDQLSFLTSHPNHLNAFIQFSTNDAKYRFKNHFRIESLEFEILCAIYQSLQRLSKAEYRSVSESRYQYSLERRRGFLDNEVRLSRSSSASISKEWARKQITNATFAFAFEQSPRSQNSDSDQFVLVHTLNGRHFCTVTSWPRCLSFHLPYEVMGQDLLLNDGLLFLMPLPSKKTKNEKLVLLVLDLRQGQGHGYEEKGRFYWSKGRRPPNVYKESGERRLYAYGDRIVQILPSDVWTLLVYSISKMQLVQSIEMPWADPEVIGQLFCADQQGPQLVLAFFGEKQHDDNTYPAKVVTFVIDEADDAAELLEVSVPSVRKSRFDLDQPVSHIQLFLCAATDYQIDLQRLQLYHHAGKPFARRGSNHSRSKSGPRQPLVIFLFPDGNLTSNGTYQNLVFPLGSGTKYKILPEFWSQNELVVKDTRIFVMHVIPSIGRLVYATNLNFELLWKLELDHYFGDPSCEQRLFLFASHGCAWLSSATRVLLFDQEKGYSRGHFTFAAITRKLPELESISENTSPYAQTGFSIWQVFVSGNILLIVHDIERCSPVIVDKITM